MGKSVSAPPTRFENAVFAMPLGGALSKFSFEFRAHFNRFFLFMHVAVSVQLHMHIALPINNMMIIQVGRARLNRSRRQRNLLERPNKAAVPAELGASSLAHLLKAQ